MNEPVPTKLPSLPRTVRATTFAWQRDIVATYTNEDDGVWLACKLCGQSDWGKRIGESLGFWPSMGEMQTAAMRHGVESHLS